MQRLQTLPWWALAATAAAETLDAARTRLRAAWETLTLSTEERYLRDASDLADLERRLRRLDRGSR